MTKFVGSTIDGTDVVFQYPWVEMIQSQKKSRNPIETWKRFM